VPGSPWWSARISKYNGNFFWGEKQAGKQLYHSLPNIDILAATGSV